MLSQPSDMLNVGDLVLFSVSPDPQLGLIVSTIDPGEDVIPYDPARSSTSGDITRGEEMYIILSDACFFRILPRYWEINRIQLLSSARGSVG